MLVISFSPVALVQDFIWEYFRLGGGTDYGACGDAYLEKFKSGTLRSLLKSYLYPNATSPTRLHGNTAVRHDHQSSQGTSVTVVDLVCVGPDENRHLIDELATWTRTACTLCFTMKLGRVGGGGGGGGEYAPDAAWFRL